MAVIDPTPNYRDRELVNEAMARAFAAHAARSGKQPMSSEQIMTAIEITKSISSDSGALALKGISVEIEIAVATARLEERERCAKIAEQWQGSKGLRSEQLSTELAAKIRAGE